MDDNALNRYLLPARTSFQSHLKQINNNWERRHGKKLHKMTTKTFLLKGDMPSNSKFIDCESVDTMSSCRKCDVSFFMFSFAATFLVVTFLYCTVTFEAKANIFGEYFLPCSFGNKQFFVGGLLLYPLLSHNTRLSART